VEDAAVLYDIIKGHDPKDSTSADFEKEPIHGAIDPDRKLRIAVIENYVEEAGEDVKKAHKRAVEALEAEGLKVEDAELAQFAKNEIELDVKDTLSILNLIETLEDLDDVDKVYSNLAISDEALAQLGA
jgi:Asp-tRNA(Asn)/Glu-tRNA(Gln) amidotransferase A subunit family amidase